MSNQDWGTVTFSRSGPRRGASKQEKAAAQRSAARRGNVTQTKKYGGGGNSAQHGGGKNTMKLDEETEVMKHDQVDIHFGKALMQARMAAKMTQKQLAQKLNVKASIVQNYEKAKGIPNPRLISNMERALNCKLPRKKKKKKGGN